MGEEEATILPDLRGHLPTKNECHKSVIVFGSKLIQNFRNQLLQTEQPQSTCFDIQFSSSRSVFR